MHLLLTFHNGMKEEELIAAAKKAGIKVYGLSGYYVALKPSTPATILLGYANMREESIDEAVKTLKEVWGL